MTRLDFLKTIAVFACVPLLVEAGGGSHRQAIDKLADTINSTGTKFEIHRMSFTIMKKGIKTQYLDYIQKELDYKVKIHTTGTYNPSNYTTDQVLIVCKSPKELKALLSELLPLIKDYRIKTQITRVL